MTKLQPFGYSLAILASIVSIANSGLGQENRDSSGQHRASSPVSRELEKLFSENGQEMPSMRAEDLPYASTPQLDRLRKVDSNSPVAPSNRTRKPLFGLRKRSQTKPSSGKNQGILGRMFGRFPGKSESESVSMMPESRPPDVPPVSSDPSEIADSARLSQNSFRAVSQGHKVEPSSPRPARESDHDRVPEFTLDHSDKEEELFPSPFSEGAEDLFDGESLIPTDTDSDISAGRESDEPASYAKRQTNLDENQSLSDWDDFETAEVESPFTGAHIVPDVESLPLVDEDLLLAKIADSIQQNSAETDSVKEAPVETAPVGVTPTEEDIIAAMPERQQRADWRHSLNESRRGKKSELTELPGRVVAAGSDRLQTIQQQEKGDVRNQMRGLMGYSPVAHQNDQKLNAGSGESETSFGLDTCTFGSEKSLVQFESNPKLYIPTAGGNDVVVLVNSGDEKPGLLKFAGWYRDRLYLFHSPETMALFFRDPTKYADHF